MVPLLSKHGGQSFVETGCLSPHSSCGQENKGSKRRVLRLTYPLFIRSFFLLLMLSVTGGRCLVLVGGGIGVEDTHIKKINVFSGLPPHTPFAETSSLALSCELAVAPDSWYDIVGCRLGSMHTSLHTFVRYCLILVDFVISLFLLGFFHCLRLCHHITATF